MENFLIIIIYLLIGVLLKKIPVFGKETPNILNYFVIYISLPALILLKLHSLIFSSNLLIPVLTAWGILFITAFIILFLSKNFGWNRKTTGCLLLIIPLGNTSFLGIPMVDAFFGEGAVLYAVIYDQLGSFLALAIYGSIIIALYSGEVKKPVPRKIVKKIITFPPFLALLVAFALKPISYPETIEIVLQSLGATLVPLVMIAVGFQLSLRIHKEEMAPLSIGLALKLIAAPVIVLALFKVLGIKGEASQVSVFEAGMPPMVSAGALAIIADLSPSLSAALVGLGIIISFITLPLLFQIL